MLGVKEKDLVLSEEIFKELSVIDHLIKTPKTESKKKQQASYHFYLSSGNASSKIPEVINDSVY